MNRVLVTGATGFVGGHLVEALVRDGVSVVAAVRKPQLLHRCWKAVSVTPFDLDRPDAFDSATMRGVDCVYHLAARVHVMRSTVDDERRFMALNVKATEILAMHAARMGVRRFVFVSSVKVNGEETVGRPFAAGDSPAPQDAYGRSKFEAERTLMSIGARTGLAVAVVRPPLVYGPGVGANFRRLLSLVDLGVPLPLGAVHNQRSMVSVWNLVDILRCIAVHPRAANRVWMVSDNDDVSTSRLVRLIGEGLQRRVRLFPVPAVLLRGLGRIAGRSGEVGRLLNSLQVDISATLEELEWDPPVSLSCGIARTAGWFKEMVRADE